MLRFVAFGPSLKTTILRILLLDSNAGLTGKLLQVPGLTDIVLFQTSRWASGGNSKELP